MVVAYMSIYVNIHIFSCCSFLIRKLTDVNLENNLEDKLTSEVDSGNSKRCLCRNINYSLCYRSLQIDWTSPGNPNGIILGYGVLRKSWFPCSKTQKAHSSELCKAVMCQKPETTCGHRCYDPEAKVNLFKSIRVISLSHPTLQVKSRVS